MSDDPEVNGDVVGRGEAADDPLRERLVSSEVLKRGRILEFRIDTIEAADGRRSTREIAGHPGGVCIVAIDPEDRALLVRQWRHATGGALLEIPAGTLDRELDGSVEHHALAAARELEEETGSRAGQWRYLGGFYTAPGTVPSPGNDMIDCQASHENSWLSQIATNGQRARASWISGSRR